MKFLKAGTLIFVIVALAVFAHAENEGRIFGTITTVDGDEFEGLIRWDKNEGSWIDVLNGTKDLSDMDYISGSKKKRKRTNSISLFGLKISGLGSTFNSLSAQSGIMFGHLESFEPISGGEALLLLKSGQLIELSGGSTDIGGSVREIIIEDIDEGEIELVWDDIELIEFTASKTNESSVFGDRLYGNLTTRRGDEYSGFVCWDTDEIFEYDILDGYEKGRRKKIKFKNIDTIERYSSSGATVITKDGESMILKGTNDVDDGIRGILISNPNFGHVEVQWDDFDNLVFLKAPRIYEYDDFDGGHDLAGTVYTEDGDSFQGKIIWDMDESYTWEYLDGDLHDLEFDIEFGLIKEIAKRSYRSSIVTLLDGTTLKLRGSNDVDEDNKGIIILSSDGEETEIDWDEFEKVVFEI